MRIIDGRKACQEQLLYSGVCIPAEQADAGEGGNGSGVVPDSLTRPA